MQALRDWWSGKRGYCSSPDFGKVRDGERRRRGLAEVRADAAHH